MLSHWCSASTLMPVRFGITLERTSCAPMWVCDWVVLLSQTIQRCKKAKSLLVWPDHPLFCCRCRPVFLIFQGQFVARFSENTTVITVFEHICILKANPRIKLCIFFCSGSWELLSGLIRYQIKKWVNSIFVAPSPWSNSVSKGDLNPGHFLMHFLHSECDADSRGLS